MLRRFSVFSLAFLLCLSLFPARAFAWDVIPKGVLYQGDIEGSKYGAVVSAYNQFDAACYVLGKDPNTISASIKQKLSDPNYGGKFYEYSQYFFTQSGSLEDVPGWVPTYIVMIGELGDLVLSDYQSVWYASTTKALHDAALVDFKRVLYGEDLSGGGGSGGGEAADGTYTVEFTPSMLRRSGRFPNPGGYDPSIMTNTVTFSIDSSYDNSNRDLLNNLRRSQYIFFVFGVGSNFNSPRFQIHPASSDSYSVTGGGNNRFRFSCNEIDNKYFIPNVKSIQSPSAAGSVVVCGNPTAYTSSTYDPAFEEWNLWVYVVPTSEFFGSPAPPPPSGTWPEPVTPAAPVAPELPEPAEPVVETPVSPSVSAPSWPDITINIESEPTPGTTPSGLDYTELLTRINDNLISIDSFARAINSNLNSLRGDLLAEFNGVIDSLRNIYNYLLTIDSVLETHCTHLRNKIEQSAVFIANYMRTLIKWLADQLDFDDLTNVEAPDNSLLTTINEKLGGGTYEPNPIKDEQGYYEWLDDLWDRFLLGDNWQSSMGSISGSFSELKTRFPFSVPWDIVALFRLFVHDPVTPVFDLPLYFSSDGSTPVHVDLSPWDSVASLVRPMVFVIFALKLALLSRDLLGGLGADKGGL